METTSTDVINARRDRPADFRHPVGPRSEFFEHGTQYAMAVGKHHH